MNTSDRTTRWRGAVRMLLLGATLAGCAAPGPDKVVGTSGPVESVRPGEPVARGFKWVRTPALIAHRPEDTVSVARRMNWTQDPTQTGIDPMAMPLFRSNTALRNWLDLPFHRALAIGNPERCGYSYRTYNFRSQEAAAERALDRCLKRVTGFGPHVTQTCGCQLVMVDDWLLVEPGNFPRHAWLPGILLIRERGSEVRLNGMVRSSGFLGSNLPFVFFDAPGREVCQGTYSLSLRRPAFGGGDIAGRCIVRGRSIAVEGELRVEGLLAGGTIGVGRMSLGSDGEVIIVFGLTAEEFERRRDEFVE